MIKAPSLAAAGVILMAGVALVVAPQRPNDVGAASSDGVTYFSPGQADRYAKPDRELDPVRGLKEGHALEADGIYRIPPPR